MKYANDPFWVKLRWILFIAFWALWVGMLVGAILIIVLAPKCAAPIPLSWYQKGPLVTIKDANDGDVAEMKKLEVQGVIYELPAEDTYFVGTPRVDDKIKGIVEKYKTSDINVILDLTPNYVTQADELFVKAKDAEENSEELAAFTTAKKDVNWLKFGTRSGEKAFQKFGKHTFLSQFGTNIDVRLDNPLIKEKFQNVLSKLVDIGVKGFRLKNAKFFKVGDLTTELPKGEGSGLTQESYEFFTHTQTTYQSGLGDLISQYAKYVHNITNDEGFLTITDSITGHEDKFHTNNRNITTIGYDLPKLAVIRELSSSSSPDSTIAKKVVNIFASQERTSPVSDIWTQLPFTADSYKDTEKSAYYMFISLMRGVLIAPLDAFTSIDSDKFTKLKDERKKDAVQFGKFDILTDLHDSGVIGYTR